MKVKDWDAVGNVKQYIPLILECVMFCLPLRKCQYLRSCITQIRTLQFLKLLPHICRKTLNSWNSWNCLIYLFSNLWNFSLINNKASFSTPNHSTWACLYNHRKQPPPYCDEYMLFITLYVYTLLQPYLTNISWYWPLTSLWAAIDRRKHLSSPLKCG